MTTFMHFILFLFELCLQKTAPENGGKWKCLRKGITKFSCKENELIDNVLKGSLYVEKGSLYRFSNRDCKI